MSEEETTAVPPELEDAPTGAPFLSQNIFYLRFLIQ